MGAVERLREKIKRAEKHISDLKALRDTFLEKAYRVESKDDPKTRERIWYVAEVKPIPDEIPLILGDAVHCLHCALDHLAYRLAWVATAGAGPFGGLYFPFGDDAADFADKLRRSSQAKTKARGVVHRLRPDAVKAIQTKQPYQGGRGEALWHIHRLDIIDKHHLLLTVGLSIRLTACRPARSQPRRVVPRSKMSTPPSSWLSCTTLPRMHVSR